MTPVSRVAPVPVAGATRETKDSDMLGEWNSKRPADVVRPTDVVLARWGLATLFLRRNGTAFDVFSHVPTDIRDPGPPGERMGLLFPEGRTKPPAGTADIPAWFWSRPWRRLVRGPEDPLLALPVVDDARKAWVARHLLDIVTAVFAGRGLEPLPEDVRVGIPDVAPQKEKVIVHIIGTRYTPEWAAACRTVTDLAVALVFGQGLYGLEAPTAPIPGADNDTVDVFSLDRHRQRIWISVDPSGPHSAQELAGSRRRLDALGLLDGIR